MTDRNTIALHNLRRIRDEIDAQIAAIEAEPSKCGMEWMVKRQLLPNISLFEASVYFRGGVARLSIEYDGPNAVYRAHQGAKP